MSRVSAGRGSRRRTVRFSVASLVALTVLAVGGCQDDPAEVDPLPTPTAEPPPRVGLTPPPRDWAPVAGLVRPDGGELEVVEVELTVPLPAAAVEVVRTLDYRLGAEDTVSVHDLADDGTAVVSLFHPDDFDGGSLELLAPARVALWSDTGMAELPSSEPVVPGEPFRQVSGAAAVDDSVVWLETSVYGMGESSWRVLRAGPDTGAALLARSEDADAGADDVIEPFPVSFTVAGDRAAWALEGLRPDGTLSAAVLAVPVAGGPMSIVAGDATLPVATGAGLSVLSLTADTGMPMRLELVGPGDPVRPLVGFPEPSDDGPHVPTLVADGDLVAWVLNEGLYAASVDGGQTHRLRSRGSLDPDSVAVCDGRVVWAPAVAEGYPQERYVFDHATAATSVLALGPHQSTVICGGPFLSWTEVREADDGEVHTVVVARWAE